MRLGIEGIEELDVPIAQTVMQALFMALEGEQGGQEFGLEALVPEGLGNEGLLGAFVADAHARKALMQEGIAAEDLLQSLARPLLLGELVLPKEYNVLLLGNKEGKPVGTQEYGQVLLCFVFVEVSFNDVMR